MKKNLLICCTDAGGASNISLVASKLINNNNFSVILYCSSFTYNYFSFCSELTKKEKITTLKDAELFIDKYGVKTILCGTTRSRESAENYFIKAANNNNILNVAYVDEWYNYHKRFEDNNGSLSFLPQRIALIDKRALDGAIKDNIPKKKCFITGSPTLNHLWEKRLTYHKNPPELPDKLEYMSNKFVVTFLSETHLIDFGSRVGRSGKYGSYLGFTEQTVLDDIMNIIVSRKLECILVEKLHPADKRKSEKKQLNNKIDYIRIQNLDLHSLIWHSDIVIGMTSIALLESSILNKNVVSYQPNLIAENYCSACKFGLIPLIKDPLDLEEWIIERFHHKTEKNKPTLEKHFDFISQSDPVDNIINLLN